MRITNNIIFQRLLNSVTNNLQDYRTTQTQIATERKMFNPSDDPQGIGLTTSYHTDYSSYEKYLENLTEAEELLRASDSALDELNIILNQAREVAESNSTESATTESRQIGSDQIDELIGQSMEILNKQVRNRYIFSGYRTNQQAFSDVGKVLDPYAHVDNNYQGVVSTQGDFEGTENKTYEIRIVTAGGLGTAEFQISEDGGENWGSVQTMSSTIDLFDDINGTESGVDAVFAPGDFEVGDQFKVYIGKGLYQGDNGKIEVNSGKHMKVLTNITGQETVEDHNYFGIMHHLKIALDNDNTREISSALEDLKNLQDDMERELASTGSHLNRINISRNNLTSVSQDVLEKIQYLEKPDLVEAMAEFSMQENALNASVSVMSKVFPTSLLKYI